MAEALPKPPPGFEIDQSSIPPPPPGFELEGAASAPPTRIDFHYATPQDRVSNAVEGVTGSSFLGGAASMATKAALPMAGSAIGSRVGAVFGPAGVIGGEMIGS